MTEQIILPFDVELPPSTMLKAGDLTCMYECGNLRYISLGKTELVRIIYGAVRNENWETALYDIVNEKIAVSANSFHISYTASYRLNDIKYQADFIIEGNEDNRISFSMKGIALAPFRANRIGLCVHHPLKEYRGKAAIITANNDEKYINTFPEDVSSHQPFKNISRMELVVDNMDVAFEFQGDVFETEDQRNWGDSSFKTYCTPLELPYPVSVRSGDRIEQSITLKVKAATSINKEEASIATREEKHPFPKIGYCRSKNQPMLSAATATLFHHIPFDHYRVEINMGGDWQKEIEEALQEAILLRTKIELVVYFNEQFKKDISDLIVVIKKDEGNFYSVLLFQNATNISSVEVLEYSYPLIRSALLQIKAGYGTDLYFADLNRNRPGNIPFDFISFAIHPQVHAFDTRSLLENLECQPDIVSTALGFSHSKPIHVSPLTFKDRFNNNNTTGKYLTNSGADKRQYSDMAASWTLMSIQQFSKAECITMYELFGEEGLINYNEEEKILSPLYKMLVNIRDFKPVMIVQRFAGDELLMDGLLLEDKGGKRLLFRVADAMLNFKES